MADLARRSAMSRRTFARRFAATTGTTPYQWLLRQRLQRAQRLLETTESPIDTVSRDCGFVTAVNLRKHFRALRTTPPAYRNRPADAAGRSAGHLRPAMAQLGRDLRVVSAASSAKVIATRTAALR